MANTVRIMNGGTSTRLLPILLAAILCTGSALIAGTVEAESNRWEYRVFWTHEPDLHTVCYEPEQSICYNKNVGRRITEIADKGWEILRIERQKYFDRKQRRYYFIYARRQKQ